MQYKFEIKPKLEKKLKKTRKAPFGCKSVVALAKHWVVPIG